MVRLPYNMHGGFGPLSSLVGGAGPSSSIAGGVAGFSSFFVGGGLGAHHIVCGWWWCALVMPFVGGGALLSVFVWHGAWPLSLSWWSCHCSRERVVSHSCLQTVHLLSSCVGILCHFCVLSSRVLVVMCPHHCCMSLIVVACPSLLSCDLTMLLSPALLFVVL